MRELPHNDDAETQLLGSCLIGGAATVSLSLEGKISAGSFFEPSRGRIFAFLTEMSASGLEINDSTFIQELMRKKLVESLGGIPYLVSLSGAVSTTANARQLIKVVRELEVVRSALKVAIDLTEKCYAYAGQEISELLGAPAEKLLCLTAQSDEQEESWEQIIQHAERLADEMIASGGKPLASTVEFPWPQMNALFGPMQRGQLVVLAARTSVGKSSLARPITCHAARMGHKVYFDTLEVQPVRVALQMAATLARVGVRQLPLAHKEDQTDFKNALRSLKSAGITMARKDRTLAQIVGRARALHTQGRIDFAVIDHGGYIDEVQTAKSSSEKTAAVGRVTKALKCLAVDLNIPVLLLWQLNRGPDKENNREPLLSDLKDSGSVEEDADKVIFIHRPGENPLTNTPQPYTALVDECPRFFQNVIQAKGRDDGTTFMSFMFDRQTATFDPVQR